MNTYERNEFFGEFRDSYEIRLLLHEFGQDAASECENMIKNASIKYNNEKIKIRLGRMLKIFCFIKYESVPIEDKAMGIVREYLRSEGEKVYLKHGKDIRNLNWNKLKNI